MGLLVFETNEYIRRAFSFKLHEKGVRTATCGAKLGDRFLLPSCTRQVRSTTNRFDRFHLIAWCPLSVSQVEIPTTELATEAHGAHGSGGR